MSLMQTREGRTDLMEVLDRRALEQSVLSVCIALVPYFEEHQRLCAR